MPVLRLIADDLTGALDSAAPFAQASGPIPVFWNTPAGVDAQESIVISLGTRELSEEETFWLITGAARLFDNADICYHKVDSLLRGHPALEISTIAQLRIFDMIIVAPAFPSQGRVTRNGIQYFRSGSRVPNEAKNTLYNQLRTRGHNIRVISTGPFCGADGDIVICDADSDESLANLVAYGNAIAGKLLWVGAGGLARALAGWPIMPDRCAWSPRQPVLAIIGTNHPTTLRQVQAVVAAGVTCTVSVDVDFRRNATLERLETAIMESQPALLIFTPPEYPQGGAQRFIEDALHEILPNIPRPRNLVVSGGETLYAVCQVLRCDHLEVIAERSPGCPLSLMRGGLWDGMHIISKSGAFGRATTLVRLMREQQNHGEAS